MIAELVNVAGNAEYWDRFYAGWRFAAPSQFAAMIAAELQSDHSIIDIGCGNGRDSFFFANQGRNVLGVDASTVAIAANSERADGSPNLTFRAMDAADRNLGSLIRATDKPCVYSRFFLHAIDQMTEQRLLQTISEALPTGGRVYFEYRTTQDAELAKTYGDHYRRYINHAALVNRLRDRYGFTVEYEIQGFGMAKFKTEDPHVGRVVCQR